MTKLGYEYRIREILKYVKGKKVLDLGCVQHSSEKANAEDWLHKILAKHASYILGVDILEDEVKKLRDMGYNVVAADVEKMDLPEKDFDVIVAGELIEHLSNPGLFLENCRKHLRDGGLLIITTPNPFCFLFVRKSIVNNLKINPEHVAWYDEITLKQLLERYKFEPVEIKYLEPPQWGISKILYKLGFRKFGSLNLFAVFKKI